MVPLVCEAFSQKELARLIASSGVVYPGVRIETLPVEELAEGWVEDAWDSLEVFSSMVKALDKAHAKDLEQMQLSSVDDMGRMIQSIPDICRRRKIGGLLWALLRDERSDAAMIKRFLESFYCFLDKLDGQAKRKESFEDHLWKGRLNKKETEKVRQMLFNLIGENKAIKKALDKELKGKERWGRQIEGLKKKERAANAEITSIRKELGSLRRDGAIKNERICELEQQAKTTSRAEEQSLRRRVHDLERNERKMCHEISELNEKLASSRADVKAKDGLCLELQRELKTACQEKERLEGEVKQLAAQAGVRDDSMRTMHKASVPIKNKGQRLGVFMDTRHLRQAVRLLKQKIDFEKLLNFVVLDRYLVKAVAYVMTAPDMDSSGFLRMLEKKGFQVRSRNFIKLPDGSMHGCWGPGIAIDAMNLAEKLELDIIHLVGGDGDFADLLKFLKAKRIRVEASGFRINSAEELVQAADEFVFLGEEIFRIPVSHT